jgi:hypothetical protein
MKLRTLGLLAAAVAGMMASASAARAAAVLSFSNGASTVVLTDDGVSGVVSGGFKSSTGTGTLSWTGSIGGWSVVVNTGQSKTDLGSATSPKMELDVTVNKGTGSAAANLYVAWSDDGYTYNDGLAEGFTLVNASSNINATYQLFKSTGEKQVLGSTLTAGGSDTSVGPLFSLTGPGLAQAANGAGSVAGAPQPFALTQYITITAGAGQVGAGAGASLAAVPVPAAAWMGLSTLAGMGGLGMIRRRARKA